MEEKEKYIVNVQMMNIDGVKPTTTITYKNYCAAIVDYDGHKLISFTDGPNTENDIKISPEDIPDIIKLLQAAANEVHN